jgi:IS1 family transposase
MCLDDGRTRSFWRSKRCWSRLASRAISPTAGGAYERHVEAEQHTVGKANTQKIESKHINLRKRIKRLVRRTICFSKTERMHDLVIGLFINRYEFGRPL